MAVISVDSGNLAWLGTECERLAGTVVSTAPTVSGGFGATSAGVQTLHCDVDGAARRIASRLRSTGDTVSSAGRDFAVTGDEHEDDVYIDLDEDERRLMVLALNEYSGLAKHGSDLLPPIVGTSNVSDFFTYFMRLRDTIDIGGPLTDLEWARALFLCEASFGSQLVGTGSEWEIGQSGDKQILALRSLQGKVSQHRRALATAARERHLSSTD